MAQSKFPFNEKEFKEVAKDINDVRDTVKLIPDMFKHLNISIKDGATDIGVAFARLQVEMGTLIAEVNSISKFVTNGSLAKSLNIGGTQSKAKGQKTNPPGPTTGNPPNSPTIPSNQTPGGSAGGPIGWLVSHLTNYMKSLTGLTVKQFGLMALTYKVLQTFHEMDKHQKKALSLGTNLNNIYESTKDMFAGLKTSISQDLSIRMEMLSEGIRIANRETFELGAIMKSTGQDSSVLAGFIKRATLMSGMTNKELSMFANSIKENAIKNNISIESLIGSMESLESAIRPFDLAGMGPLVKDAMTPIVAATKATESDLAEVLSLISSDRGEKAMMMFAPREFEAMQTATDATSFRESFLMAIDKLGGQLELIGGKRAGMRTLATQRAFMGGMGLEGMDRILAIRRNLEQTRMTDLTIGRDTDYAKSFSQTKERLVDNTIQSLIINSVGKIANEVNETGNKTNTTLEKIHTGIQTLVDVSRSSNSIPQKAIK